MKRDVRFYFMKTVLEVVNFDTMVEIESFFLVTSNSNNYTV